MSKIFKKFKEGIERRDDKILKVIALSGRLQIELKMTDDQIKELVEEKKKIICGSFNVIGVHRYFMESVMYLLEIIEKDLDYDPKGYDDADCLPYWVDDANWGGTVNLPPDQVINEVIYFINERN